MQSLPVMDILDERADRDRSLGAARAARQRLWLSVEPHLRLCPGKPYRTLSDRKQASECVPLRNVKPGCSRRHAAMAYGQRW